MPLHCPGCGRVCEDDDRFCAECGRSLSEDAVQPHGHTSLRGSAAEEIAELLRRGEKIQAIKRYREATGASLLDAKNAVEKLAADAGLSGLVGTGRAGCFGLLLVLGVWGAVGWCLLG